VIKEFRAFIMKGDLVEIAVAFIMGTAFALVTTSFSKLITDFIAAVLGAQVSFDELTITIRSAEVNYGRTLTALVNFLIIAFVLFLIVKAYNTAKDKFVRKQEAEAAEEVQLLREIRDALASTRD